MSTADIVILCLSVAAVIGSIVLAVRRHRQGNFSCGGDCTHCAGCDRKKKE